MLRTKKITGMILAVILAFSCVIMTAPEPAHAALNLENSYLFNKTGYVSIEIPFYSKAGKTPYNYGARKISIQHKKSGSTKWVAVHTWSTKKELSAKYLKGKDEKVKIGAYDYRVKITDKNGKVTHRSIWNSSWNYYAPLSGLKAVYNKTAKTVNVTFVNPNSERQVGGRAVIYDAEGEELYGCTFQNTATSCTISLTKALPAGTYKVKACINPFECESAMRTCTLTVK